MQNTKQSNQIVGRQTELLQKRRPELRCPLCGKSTPLPASICAHCRADFSTGYRKPRSWIFSVVAKKIMPVAMLGAFLAVAAGGSWLINHFISTPKLIVQPIKIKHISIDNPEMLRSYVIIQKAMDVVEKSNRNLNKREEFMRQMNAMDKASMLDKQGTEHAVKLSPAQRAHMLKEISAIIGDGRENGADYRQTGPGQRKR